LMDAGHGYDDKAYNQTGIAVLVGTVVLTLMIWVVGLMNW
jgi:succinate dehydrogenase/fumarate reductase cytochrome b subunit